MEALLAQEIAKFCNARDREPPMNRNILEGETQRGALAVGVVVDSSECFSAMDGSRISIAQIHDMTRGYYVVVVLCVCGAPTHTGHRVFHLYICFCMFPSIMAVKI